MRVFALSYSFLSGHRHFYLVFFRPLICILSFCDVFFFPRFFQCFFLVFFFYVFILFLFFRFFCFILCFCSFCFSISTPIFFPLHFFSCLFFSIVFFPDLFSQFFFFFILSARKIIMLITGDVVRPAVQIAGGRPLVARSRRTLGKRRKHNAVRRRGSHGRLDRSLVLGLHVAGGVGLRR